MDGRFCRPSILFCALLASLLLGSVAACQPRQRTATLALLGDINLGRDVHPSAESLAYLAADMKNAGLALANLESPLAEDLPGNASGYNLCAPAERANLLSTWGLDLVSIVNNHSSDCGEYGALQNIAALESVGLTPIWDSSEPVYRELNGVRLAFLALDDVGSAVDAEAAVRSIRSADEKGNVVIVSIHWGMEYQSGASERQKLLARQFAEAGAAVVWGHHPHVLQPVEWIDMAHGKTLVLYSLGNALFDQVGLQDTRQSALALVELNAEGVQSVRAVPFVIDVQKSTVEAPDTATAESILEQMKIK